ncbi:sensor histidine kinase [Mucilaginibacter terrae]|uniref:Two-component system LytT family sensor kinase n=1 Tax=Mucilaginibacter terrae TaxID=1955052 RepID=A0ABU3GW28_9SPHI|nr:histidine kinase [Mucilaginibacter terrae]MDT3403980.1 two-component system LytT family sensor kinase [Mucilaginibacter terrae]
MLRSKATTFTIHAAGWLLFLIFPLLFLSGGQKNSNVWTLLSSSYYWLFCLTYMVLFYFNLWLLIPRFFLKKKYVDYGIGVMLLLSCVYFLQPFDKLLANNPRVQSQIGMPGGLPPPPIDTLTQVQPKLNPAATADSTPLPFGPLPHQDLRMQDPAQKPHGNPLWRHSPGVDIVSLVLFVIMTALSLSIRMVQQWQTTEQKVIVAEAGKANAELSFLKAQINPHFLFNTLNNIYTLSVMNSEHTSESIMKLSNIMRYVTDEVSENFVLLQNDVNCISDYIALQSLRLGRKAEVKFTVSGNMSNQKIAPLILMSFVENAFKYGISKQEFSLITIDINVEGAKIEFYCENKIFNNKLTVIERTGIGIANTRQRLQHLYPGRYELKIDDAGNRFKVKLSLQS